ncbi:MAG: nucleoside 2-deoxyribosyltransferase [Bacteroidetes bacterium]|nr:nucleoside 2-deoxyribosyltransferase [Bacteroidota bacterium]MBU1678767.1 nucleoside 2-deoxyribosyltransferase [Bacteroidota bacterium]MBU2505140.1 nucleoside 2-deoxyribosyltransferase [Bacteroidota bacterium]
MRPDIEHFVKTLRLQKPEYIPIAELGVHPKIKEKLLGRPIIVLKDDVDFWHKAGYDYIKLQPKVDFNPAKIGQSDKAVFQEDGRMDFKWASEGEGIIKSFDDFEKYTFPKVSDFDYSNFEKVKKMLPEGMGVIGQYGDIFTMTWEMMGFEGFSFALFENPELVKALNEKLGNLVISMFEYFAQSDVVDAIWFSDDIAYTNGLMMSPEVFDEYFFPWLKKIGELAKKSNKPLIYHTDGILYDVFDRIIDCGVNAIHPIEPKSMEIAEVKKKYGDKLCLIGHVDVDLLSRGTIEEIKAKVRENIESVGMNGGYCAGSGNSIPEYVKFENYLALIEAAKEYKF